MTTGRSMFQMYLGSMATANIICDTDEKTGLMHTKYTCSYILCYADI